MTGATQAASYLRPARLLLLAALGLSAWPALATAPAAAGAEMQGDHVVSWGSVEVVATPDLVFAVLTDYGRMAQFLPGMLASSVVSRDGKSVVVDQTADEGVLFFRQRVTARLAIDEAPPYRLTLKSLSGSFKELTGSYVLTHGHGRTLIEYKARFVPRFPLPAVIGMFAVQHSLERHLEGMAAEIRRRSPGGGAAKPAPAASAAAEPRPAVPLSPHGE